MAIAEHPACRRNKLGLKIHHGWLIHRGGRFHQGGTGSIKQRTTRNVWTSQPVGTVRMDITREWLLSARSYQVMAFTGALLGLRFLSL